MDGLRFFAILGAAAIFIGLTVAATALIGSKTTCPSVVLEWEHVWRGIFLFVWIPMGAAFAAGRSSKYD